MWQQKSFVDEKLFKLEREWMEVSVDVLNADASQNL